LRPRPPPTGGPVSQRKNAPWTERCMLVWHCRMITMRRCCVLCLVWPRPTLPVAVLGTVPYDTLGPVASCISSDLESANDHISTAFTLSTSENVVLILTREKLGLHTAGMDRSQKTATQNR
jgi:hypothetical protein